MFDFLFSPRNNVDKYCLKTHWNKDEHNSCKVKTDTCVINAIENHKTEGYGCQHKNPKRKQSWPNNDRKYDLSWLCNTKTSNTWMQQCHIMVCHKCHNARNVPDSRRLDRKKYPTCLVLNANLNNKQYSRWKATLSSELPTHENLTHFNIGQGTFSRKVYAIYSPPLPHLTSRTTRSVAVTWSLPPPSLLL